MPDRYYIETPIRESQATLAGSEAHHLLHVMRAKTGLKVIVFDGLGGEFDATVVYCGRTEVQLEVGPRKEIERELPYKLTLAVALPKGDRQRWLVEKSVELGVTRFIPLKTIRSAAGAEQSSKLARYVVSASKQCGRNRLMQIEPSTSWVEFLKQPIATRQLLAHPQGHPLPDFGQQPQTDIGLAIGPEGGFTEDEVDSAIAVGWEKVSLGRRILRIETAALAMASAIVLGSNHSDGVAGS